MNYTFLALFMLFSLLGCNTEMADLGRISSQAPFIVQLGTKTKLPGRSNTSADNCNDVAVDQFENVICVGVTQSSMGKTSDGSLDAFISKHDRNGKLLWLKQIQSTTPAQQSCSSGGVDAEGNIYCGGTTFARIGTGQILNKVWINPAFLWLERTEAATDADAFVAKLSPTGQILWIKQFGSSSNEGCNNIAVSPSGNVYCGSKTDGELGTDATTRLDEYLGGTSSNPMVAKLDTHGNVVWIRQFGARSMPAEYMAEDQCSGIAIDDDENIYCGGGTKGNIGDTNADTTKFDPFIWILDKNGITKDLIQIGVNEFANGKVMSVSNNEACDDITVDKNKNIFCAISADGNYGELGGGLQDIILAKWNSNHDLEWVTQMGSQTKVPGFDNSAAQYPSGVSMSPDGSIIVAGSTEGSTAASNSGLSDLLLIKFGQSGELIWAYQSGSAGSDFCINGITDKSGNVYCSGSTSGNLGETNAGTADAFILRVNSLGQF